DGRFRLPEGAGRHIDARISTLPVMRGEKVVIRLLDARESIVHLEGLGFDPEVFSRIEAASDAPDGLILIVGPTGSGKTSTLYAAIRRIANPEINIVTVENPVEFEIPGLGQVNVNPKKGLT